MRAAMSVLAVLAVLAGVVFLPFGITDWFENVPRADVRRLDRRAPGEDRARDARLHPHDGRRGRRAAALLPDLGAEAGHVGGDPGAVPGLHKLFVNKWYFDELIDLVIVRPVLVGRALGA